MITKTSNAILRKFGYKKDREGLITRYLRETENWKSHIENSKKFILKSAEAKEKKLCVVAGSGWWLDIPAIELSEIFEKIIMIDITHPSQIVRKAQKYKNIELIETDLTGLAKKIYNLRRQLKNKKINFKLNEFIPKNYNLGLEKNIKPDFVISPNVLSQLHIFITDYLSSLKVFTQNELLEFEKSIQKNHIKMLPKNKSCIIVDYFGHDYNSSGKLIKKYSRISTELPKSNFSEKWNWNFDFSGNFKNKTKTVFKVAALDF